MRLAPVASSNYCRLTRQRPLRLNYSEKARMLAYTLTIAGRSVSTAKTFDVLNPADGSVVAACPEATTGDVDAAVMAARNAFPSWSALGDAERVAKLMSIADLIEQHRQELSELVTREQGKTQSGPGA